MTEPRATGPNRAAPVVLAFDTAASACSVAVGRGAEVLAHERLTMRHGHAEALLPMIDRAVTAGGLTPRDIEVIAVSVGPGGFTGIRAGLAAAQGLALAVRAQLVGVTSFAAVAALLPAGDAAILVALDSRRDDLYVQLFSAEGSATGEPAAVLPEALASWVAAAGDARLLIGGDAADSAAAALAARVQVTVAANSAPDALGVLTAAHRENFAGPARPLYIRPPDVTPPKARP